MGLQPEDFPTDFEVFDEDKHGFPTGKELMRRAKIIEDHEVVQIQDEAFFNENVIANPFVKVENTTTTTVWFAWFFVPNICARSEDCDHMAKYLRQTSKEIKKVARVVAINCSQFSKICRKQGAMSSGWTLKMYIQRQQNHFVESVVIQKDIAASVSLAGKVMSLLVRPNTVLYVPPHPYKAVEEKPVVRKLTADMNVNKLPLKELRAILKEHDLKCTGCSDKSEFVAMVKGLLPKEEEEKKEEEKKEEEKKEEKKEEL